MSASRNGYTLEQDVFEDVAWLRADSHSDAELPGTTTYGERKHTGDADYRNEQRYHRESPEYNRIQPRGRENLSANVS